MRYYRRLLRSIFKLPKHDLSWSTKDFKTAVSILKRTDNPENPKQSLWGKYNNSWYDSVDILHQANTIIRKG